MDAVAKRAGVGRATLYRNFDDINALTSAIFEENILALEAAIDREGASPGAFERVLWLTVDEGLRFRALIPALAMRAQSPEVGALVVRVTRPLSASLKVAQKQGEVRGDLTARDVVPLLAMVFSTVLTELDAKDLRARARRSLGLVFDGIRPR